MKKLAFLFIILFIAGALSACGGGSSAPSVEMQNMELARLEAQAREAGASENEINRIFREIDNLQERITELEKLIRELQQSPDDTTDTNGCKEGEIFTYGICQRQFMDCPAGYKHNSNKFCIPELQGDVVALSELHSSLNMDKWWENDELAIRYGEIHRYNRFFQHLTESRWDRYDYIQILNPPASVMMSISLAFKLCDATRNDFEWNQICHYQRNLREFDESLFLRIPTKGFGTVCASILFSIHGENGNYCDDIRPPQQANYYTLESRTDDAWATDKGFAFNMRGILRDGAIQTDNFLFAHSDNMRDMHLELRTDPITISGVGFYSDSGFKWENGGETQAHYGKMMAVYPLFAVPDNDGDNKNRAALEWDLYASAAVGKVHSSYYEDSRLFGFAAGSFVRHLFGETDEWHLRFRRPLSATEIRPLVFGADMRVGGEESHWRFGLERDLDSDDLDATANWRFEF